MFQQGAPTAQVTALVERFANTRPSATEAEAMQSGYLFAVAGVEAIGADGRFYNDPQMQYMAHLLLDPRRAQSLLDEADALEARRFGVEGPAPPAAVGADGEQEDEEEEEGDIWFDAEEEEEGFVDTGGIHGEEEEEEEEGDMDLPIANEEEGEVEGVVQKTLQFDEDVPEPAAKRAKSVAGALTCELQPQNL